MVKSDCPFFTRSPSLKFLDIRIPVTRARTSTSREPAVWPTYSQLTGSASWATVVTVTSGVGMPPIGPWPPPFSLPLEGLHAARTATDKRTTRRLKPMRSPVVSAPARGGILTPVPTPYVAGVTVFLRKAGVTHVTAHEPSGNAAVFARADPAVRTGGIDMKRIQIVAASVAALSVLSGGALYLRSSSAENKPAAAQPQAMPVAVAVIEQHDVTTWDEFSGRLEAVERVDVRSRVAGQVKAVHFAEGALVRQGDLLVTIDPDPYAAEAERAQAQVVAAQARVNYAKSERERAQRLWDESAIARRELDERINAAQEAEANLRAAQAALTSSRLNLSYTQVRAPVSGRVGRLEVTVGNLVAAGPGAPVLTTLVSVNPIYASFDADEHVVLRTLHEGKQRIAVEAETVTNGGKQLRGRLQLIDNQVNTRSGTVRVRAVFDNRDGSLIPGQYVKLRMGRAKTEPALLVSERAIGTDQDKRFVIVVGPDDKAIWRQVALGGTANGQRIVTSGLEAGERIVVNGLQRVRPGAQLAPQPAQPAGTPAAAQ